MVDSVYFSNRKDWRKWLKKNYKTTKEIWLIYFKKNSGKSRIPYNDAVEEALCFGWIDSTVKTIDNERFTQRFTPRNPKSGYSQANRERLKKLISEGQIMNDVLPNLVYVLTEKFEIPDDILRFLKSNKLAWKNFQKFSESYQHIRIAFIEGARKRPKEFKKRLDYFIKMTEKNRQFGFGGIDKYF